MKKSPLGIIIHACCSLRPWDPLNDLLQYEHNYIVQTKTRHRTPIVRTTSITNVDDQSTGSRLERVRRMKRASLKHLRSMHNRGSGSSTPDHDVRALDTESTDSGGKQLFIGLDLY
jgi:hypothetical protein